MQTKLEDSNLYPNYIDRFCEYVFDGSTEISDMHEFSGYLKFYRDSNNGVWVKFRGDKYFDGNIYKVVDWNKKSNINNSESNIINGDKPFEYDGIFRVTYYLDMANERVTAPEDVYITDGEIELSFKGLRFTVELMDYDIELLNNALEQYYYDNF